MAFAALEIELDPGKLTEQQIEIVQSVYPDYDPASGNLDRLIIEANSQESATLRFFLQEMSEEAPRGLGTLVGVPMELPVAAATTTTWTFLTDTGHVIAAGTEITLTGADGSPVGFVVTDDVTVAPGDFTVGEVAVQASQEGAAGNGLEGEASLITNLADVDSVVTDTATSGGSDGETGLEFLNRFAERMRLLADRLLLDVDFSSYYRSTISGCQRAVALDTYNPDDDTFDNEGHITVVGVDVDGEALPAGTKSDAYDGLVAHSVAGQVIHVEDPTYNEIDVEVEVVALTGYESDTVEADVIAAIEDYLSPANWGQDPAGRDDDAWLNTTVVRHREIGDAINRVIGVWYIVENSLLIETLNEQDVALTGRVPLTRPGVIDVTVDASS